MVVIGVHSIVRDGSNVILEYTSSKSNTIRVVMNAAELTVNTEDGTNFVALFNKRDTYSLDYTLSTSHSPASAEDYASQISIITRDGIVDETNSTTDTLLAAATYTGGWLDVTGFAQFTVIYSSDVIGTIYMDLSMDGVTAHRTKIVADVLGGTNTLVIVSKYMRVRWINGATNQSTFSLQTIFHISKSKNLTSTTSQPIDDKNDVELIRVVNSHNVDLARGVITDKFTIHKFARNPSSANGVWEDVWGAGGDYNFLTTATTVKVNGNDAADTAAGLGAREITVQGLDETFTRVEETIATAGTGDSASTTTTFIRVNNAFVSSGGTYGGSNYDDIDILTTGDVLLGVIGGRETSGTATYGAGQTTNSLFTMPVGRTGYLRKISVIVEGTKAADIVLYRRENIDDTSAPVSARRVVWSGDDIVGTFDYTFTSLVTFPEKTDVWFRAQASSLSVISVTYDLIIIDDII